MWLTDQQLLALPPPVFLVDEVLPERGFAVLAGDSGLGKTYIALDVAFSISTGTPWQSWTTKQTPVAYVIAEGIGGMPSRIAAWRASNAVPQESSLPIWFNLNDVQLATHAGGEAFAASVRALDPRPGLIVIDTLARCFVGMDENSAQDMGRFVAGVDRLRATGAAVLVIHHSGHIKERERGSTALRGAADTFLMLERGASGALVLSCKKQREAEPFEPIGLRLRPVALPNGASSCIVESAPAVLDVAWSPRWDAALAAMPAEATFSSWQSASGLSRSAFYRLVRAALDRGVVEKCGNGYRRVSNGKAVE